jgi:RNA polymerase-binding transcription factor DksA
VNGRSNCARKSADIARIEADARATAITETQNGAIAAESKDSLLQEATSECNIFTQVRDALQRIRLGTFGKCIDCGRQIDDHRWNAVPWTAPQIFSARTVDHS